MQEKKMIIKSKMAHSENSPRMYFYHSYIQILVMFHNISPLAPRGFIFSQKRKSTNLNSVKEIFAPLNCPLLFFKIDDTKTQRMSLFFSSTL